MCVLISFDILLANATTVTCKFRIVLLNLPVLLLCIFAVYSLKLFSSSFITFNVANFPMLTALSSKNGQVSVSTTQARKLRNFIIIGELAQFLVAFSWEAPAIS